MRRFNKIFGIGISRTGTTSLTVALECLGIPTIHWPTNFQDICKFPAATDITIACRFKELDQMFPDSLYIYTEREPESWLRSVERHYGKKHPAENLPAAARAFALEAEIKIYGRISPTRDDFLSSYRQHEASVLEYFGGREDRLLRFNVGKGDGWARLCRFLKCPRPSMPFPHWNRRVS